MCVCVCVVPGRGILPRLSHNSRLLPACLLLALLPLKAPSRSHLLLAMIFFKPPRCPCWLPACRVWLPPTGRPWIPSHALLRCSINSGRGSITDFCRAGGVEQEEECCAHAQRLRQGCGDVFILLTLGMLRFRSTQCGIQIYSCSFKVWSRCARCHFLCAPPNCRSSCCISNKIWLDGQHIATSSVPIWASRPDLIPALTSCQQLSTTTCMMAQEHKSKKKADYTTASE